MTSMCPLCNSTQGTFLLKSNDTHGRHTIGARQLFRVNKCNNCACLYIQNIKVDKNYYQKFYNEDYYTHAQRLGLLDNLLDVLYTFSIRQKEKIILKHYPVKNRKIKILDIGSGDGTFLSKLSDKFNKFGIEISPQGCAISKEKGINVFQADFFDYDFNTQKFDVITMWHVLEHIKKPQELMKKAAQLLNMNGLFIIAVPNTGSLGFKIGKKFWFHLDSPRHLFLPNEINLTSTLTSCRFKILKKVYEFYDCPLDLFWSVRFSLLRYIIYPLYPFFKLYSKETITIISQK